MIPFLCGKASQTYSYSYNSSLSDALRADSVCSHAVATERGSVTNMEGNNGDVCKSRRKCVIAQSGGHVIIRLGSIFGV